MSALISLAFVLGSMLIVEHVREKNHENVKREILDELTRKKNEKE